MNNTSRPKLAGVFGGIEMCWCFHQLLMTEKSISHDGIFDFVRVVCDVDSMAELPSAEHMRPTRLGKKKRSSGRPN